MVNYDVLVIKISPFRCLVPSPNYLFSSGFHLFRALGARDELRPDGRTAPQPASEARDAGADLDEGKRLGRA
jgi:hypothetical protein